MADINVTGALPGEVSSSGEITPTTSQSGDITLTSTDDLNTILSGNMTTTVSPPAGNICDTINTDYNIPTATICAMCFMFGIIYTFSGYRFFKAVMFLTGFMFGSVLVYMICLEEQTFTPLINTAIALGAGFLCGLLTMLVQYVGLFLTGFHFGISIATCVLILIELFVFHPETKWIPISVLVGLGVICALLTLKFQKCGTILGTSIFGGILMISCMDYYIEQFILMKYIWDRVKAEYSPQLCWYSWVILGCWPFCFVVGALIQWKITAQGYSHKQVLHNRRSQNVNLDKSRTKEKVKDRTQNTHQSRYRHLYQIRRNNGDVISQNYIQSIQHKLSPSLRHLTPVPTEPQEGPPEPESTNTTLTQIPEV